jgi:tetratricopeptide (TPR) repeat protein
VAQTDTSQAAALDEQARTAFAEGDFAGAASRFAEAYASAPHPATKYNEAMAWEQAGEPARAADAYQQALSMPGLDAARESAARDRMAELERTLAVLSIPGPEGATATVGHIRGARLPLRVHLAAGAHEVSLRKQDGSMVVRTVDAPPGKVVELVVDVVNGPAPLTPRPQPATLPATPPPEASSAPTWGWVALGGAGAFSIGAGYLGMKTLDSLDEYEASQYRDPDAQDRTRRYKLWTNVAWGAAAVSASVGVVLLLSGATNQERGASTPRSGVRLLITPSGVAAGTTF